MTNKKLWYIRTKAVDGLAPGCAQRGVNLKEEDGYIEASGQEVWAADYPELARRLKRTFKDRLKGIIRLPDLN